MQVKVKKLDPNAQLPTVAHSGEDVGYDVYALEDVTIPYGSTREVRTGLAIEAPEGHYFTIETRGSYGKTGKIVHRGIVDTGYRGEVTGHIRNTSTNAMTKDPLVIKQGDKFAQLVFHVAIFVDEFIEVDELSESQRGDTGYGSSGR